MQWLRLLSRHRCAPKSKSLQLPEQDAPSVIQSLGIALRRSVNFVEVLGSKLHHLVSRPVQNVQVDNVQRVGVRVATHLGAIEIQTASYHIYNGALVLLDLLMGQILGAICERKSHHL